MLLAFAVLALTLGAVGVYGAVSYTVGQHRREMGIRLALGETPRGLRAYVLADGLRVVLAGAGAGLLVAAAATPVVRGLLFGVAPFDPLVYLGVPLVLVAVSTVACWRPARTASRIDVIAALRSE